MKKIIPLVIAATTLSTSLAMAQEKRVLEEILVTAQKKTQSVQNVPISISVVDAKDLAQNNIFNFADILE